MRKIGGLIAIFTGLLNVIFGILGLLATKDIINIEILGDYTSLSSFTSSIELVTTILYGVSVAFGAIEMLLGYWAIKKARGFASLILLVVFLGSAILALVNSIQTNHWPVSTIISISVSGVAGLGILIGFVKGNN